VATKILNDGIWTWFNGPEAVVARGKLYVGVWTDPARPVVAALDLDNHNELVTAQISIAAPYQDDDHDNPAVLVLDSGKILAAWSYHGGDSFCATTATAHDIRQFGNPVTIQTASDDSYQQLFQIPTGTIYGFYRRGISGTMPQAFRTSTDDGATWSSSTDFLQKTDGRPYFRWRNTSPTRKDFFYADDHPEEATTSIYHGYLRFASDGTWTAHKTDGTLVGNISNVPFAHTAFTLVYNGATSESWIWDGFVYDNETTPVCVFSVYPSHATTAHEYHRAVWNGSSWTTEKICDAGTTGTADYLYAAQANYSGGVCLDRTNKDIVYTSIEYGATDFRLEQWTKSGSWSKTADISGNTSSVNARPVAVSYQGVNHVLWWEGTYTSYTSYDTGVWIYPDRSFRSAKVTVPALAAEWVHPGAQIYLPITEGSGAPSDILGNYTPTFGGTPDWQIGASGRYLNGFSTSDYVDFDDLGGDIATNILWMAVLFSNTDTTAGQYLLSLGNGGSNDPLAGIIINNGATATVTYIYRNTGTPPVPVPSISSTTCNDGNLHVLMGVTGALDKHWVYFDGVGVGDTTTATLPTFDQATLGCLRRTTASNAFLGNIYAAAVGWGFMPAPDELYRDWITGRFSGVGGVKPARPRKRLINGGRITAGAF